MNQEISDSPSKTEGVIEWVESIATAIACLLLLFVFVVQPANVDGTSMLPTLQHREKILIRSAFYTPAKGDIVVVDSYNRYGETLVKRVIATGGDTVEIKYATGEVFVNGSVLNEPYISALTTQGGDTVFPLVVPQGAVFVMGDNRPDSLDSRFAEVGFVDCRDVMGKAFFRISPLGRLGTIS